MPEDMRCNDRRRSSLGAIQLFACRPTVGARREQNNRLRVSSLRLAGPDYQPPCRFFSLERLEWRLLLICSDRYASDPSSNQVSYPAAAAEPVRCCRRNSGGALLRVAAGFDQMDHEAVQQIGLVEMAIANE